MGRPRKVTAAQEAAVLRYAARGWSRREIADEVFGDARFKDRVARVLRRERGRALPELPNPTPEEAREFLRSYDRAELRARLDELAGALRRRGAADARSSFE
jgi:hypothetical protein